MDVVEWIVVLLAIAFVGWRLAAARGREMELRKGIFDCLLSAAAVGIVVVALRGIGQPWLWQLIMVGGLGGFIIRLVPGNKLNLVAGLALALVSLLAVANYYGI